MCNQLSIMQNVQVLGYPLHIYLPIKATVQITHMGSVTLTSSLTLHKVLFVPTFNCNLLSVSKLTQDSSCVVTFFPHQ